MMSVVAAQNQFGFQFDRRSHFNVIFFDLKMHDRRRQINERTVQVLSVDWTNIKKQNFEPLFLFFFVFNVSIWRNDTHAYRDHLSFFLFLRKQIHTINQVWFSLKHTILLPMFV